MFKKYLASNYKKIIADFIWTSSIVFLLGFLFVRFTNNSVHYGGAIFGFVGMLIILEIRDYLKWVRQNK